MRPPGSNALLAKRRSASMLRYALTYIRYALTALSVVGFGRASN
jgi:hypothetical protein